MNLIAYIFNNIRQKKSRTLFYLLGITISLLSAIDMQLLTLFYSNATYQFFEPFANHDQIVEKGTSFIQFFPTSSRIDENLESDFEAELGENVIPALFLSKSEDIFRIDVSFIIGMRTEDIPILWENIALSSGRWPESPNEMLVGVNKEHKEKFSFFNHTFQVVGVIEQKFSYIDKGFIIPLETLQNVSGKINQVNVFYVSKDIERRSNIEEEFEMNHPSLDLLTQAELRDINSEVLVFTNRMTRVLISFTGFSALIFIFALNILSIYNRKTDFEIFYVLGAPKRKIFSILWLENFFFLLISAFIAIPLSLFVYVCLYSYMSNSVKNTSRYFYYIKRGFTQLFNNFPGAEIFIIVGILIFINLALAAITMIFGLRKYDLGNLKDKF